MQSMVRKRKLWKISYPELPNRVDDRPESAVKVDTYIRDAAANWQCGALKSPRLVVYIDERDGFGWQIYNEIDLREYVG